jgi:hypothetical protein
MLGGGPGCHAGVSSLPRLPKVSSKRRATRRLTALDPFRSVLIHHHDIFMTLLPYGAVRPEAKFLPNEGRIGGRSWHRSGHSRPGAGPLGPEELLDCGDEVFRQLRLRHKTRCAKEPGQTRRLIGRPVATDKNNLCIRRELTYLVRRGQPTQNRHDKVHDHDIRLLFPTHVDGNLAIFGFAKLPARLIRQHGADGSAHKGLVIYYEYCGQHPVILENGIGERNTAKYLRNAGRISGITFCEYCRQRP